MSAPENAASGEWQWLSTGPNPRTAATGPDAGQRGWRLHAVRADEDATFDSIRARRSACGLRPRHGWSLDLFIEQRCAGCLAALGGTSEQPQEAPPCP